MSRFPRYLKALRNMKQEGKEHFLSSELSEATGILDTTIRRNFGFLTEKNLQEKEVLVMIQKKSLIF